MNAPQFTPAIFGEEQKNKKGDSLTDEIEKRRIEKKRRRYD